LKTYKVVVTGRILSSALDLIREQCEVQMWDQLSPIPQEILYEWVKDADGIFSTGDVKVNDTLLQHGPKVRVITQASVGYDNVDVESCTKRGIPFGNTPGVLVEATADLTFGLLLCAARRIFEGAMQVRSGQWRNNYEVPFGNDLFDKTLGIVGMGSIGAAVAKRAQASGMKVIYHNRTRRHDDDVLGTTYVSFYQLLEQSDFVVVLVPLTEQSCGLFSREQFAMMKSTAYLVNASRGPVVDTEALYEALKAKQIAYAALDVTDPEPIPADHPLLTLENVLITPHIGSATYETRNRMALLAAENLLAGLARKPLKTCVNEIVNYTM
jgi:glyoxylate reductase